jgi:penicillin-binding protein 1A
MMRKPVPEAARITLCALVLLANASVGLAEDAAAVITPEAVRAFYETQVVDAEVLPKIVQDAFVAAEDENFYRKDGALSGISQRIAKWLIPSGLDMVSRKMREFSTTVVIGQTLAKEEILAWYLNVIYLGRGCYGVKAASVAYFGKTPDALTLAEAATLATLALAPTIDPLREPERSLERRNAVLAEMVKAGFVTEAAGATAAASPLAAMVPPGRCEG